MAAKCGKEALPAAGEALTGAWLDATCATYAGALGLTRQQAAAIGRLAGLAVKARRLAGYLHAARFLERLAGDLSLATDAVPA